MGHSRCPPTPYRFPRSRVTLGAVLRVIALFVVLLACHFVACSPKCEGVDNAGRCETACHDDACVAGSKCVDNACSKSCTATGDCLTGESCEQRVADYGVRGSYCVGGAPRPTVAAGGDGASCASSSDCAEKYGYRCIGGACTLTCDLHPQCGTRGTCTGTAKDTEGHAVSTCESKDGFLRGPGQYGTSCPHGNECDASHDFECVSAGPGDIDAYCTRKFCADDTACPSGTFCSSSQSKQQPCADACGLTGALTSPSDGGTAKDCVVAADIGPGKHFQCGPLSLVLNVCLYRSFCNTCTSNADCRSLPNQVCAKDESGEKICTVLCDPNLNSCPWGNAASCGIWDKDLGVATCEHRFGSCRGTGASCEPCVEQTDCPKGWCNKAQFTGERYCIDGTVSCACPAGTTSTCVGGGCPLSPGGRDMNCFGGSDFTGQPVAGECIGAPADSSEPASKESCWPK